MCLHQPKNYIEKVWSQEQLNFWPSVVSKERKEQSRRRWRRCGTHCQVEWNGDWLGEIPLSVPVMMFPERFSYRGMTYPKASSQGLGDQNEEVEKKWNMRANIHTFTSHCCLSVHVMWPQPRSPTVPHWPARLDYFCS